MKDTVSIQGATILCAVSRRTIYNWLALGKIKGIRTAGGSVRIYKDTLFRELNSNEFKINGRQNGFIKTTRKD